MSHNRHQQKAIGSRPLRLGMMLATGLLAAGLALTACGTPTDTAVPTTMTATGSTAAPTQGGGTGETSMTATTGTSATSATTTAPATTAVTSATSAATSATTASTTGTSATATPGTLPQNALVESYFGPLPKASQVKPLQHNEIRAIYLGVAANMDAAINIARTTEVNAVVIDLKESDGVKFATKVPLAVQSGVVRTAYNLQNVVQRLHNEKIKVIGRIVCFKDPMLAEARPDLTIKDQGGNILKFSLEGGKPFVSPYSQAVWQYNVDIALEAIAMGVDEIQFDYIRFPTGGTTSGAKPYFGAEGSVPSKIQAINRFLQYARVRIQDETGTPLGADVFAAIIISKRDGEIIGQDWASLGLTGIDSLSPMAYPPHFPNHPPKPRAWQWPQPRPGAVNQTRTPTLRR